MNISKIFFALAILMAAPKGRAEDNSKLITFDLTKYDISIDSDSDSVWISIDRYSDRKPIILTEHTGKGFPQIKRLQELKRQLAEIHTYFARVNYTDESTWYQTSGRIEILPDDATKKNGDAT